MSLANIFKEHGFVFVADVGNRIGTRIDLIVKKFLSGEFGPRDWTVLLSLLGSLVCRLSEEQRKILTNETVKRAKAHALDVDLRNFLSKASEPVDQPFEEYLRTLKRVLVNAFNYNIKHLSDVTYVMGLFPASPSQEEKYVSAREMYKYTFERRFSYLIGEKEESGG